MSKSLLVGMFVAIALLVGGWLVLQDEDSVEVGEVGVMQRAVEVVSEVMPKSTGSASSRPQVATDEMVDFSDAVGAHAAYDFTGSIPRGWEVETVPEIEAINIYDPAVAGATNLEKSQIFLRHFKANDFLTLSTVTIHSQAETTINGHEVVVYDIEKKAGVANFPSQPSWRSGRHTVTDIRVTPTGSSEFIVIGQRPDLSQQVFDEFMESLRFPGESLGSELVPPVAGFVDSVTLKPFGIKITLTDSPVQPERFSGYHTAADAELPGDTPVVAVADGLVLRSGTASGYGGLVAIEHELDEQRVVGIYGHLDPASLIKQGAAVRQGEQIGRLGEGFSAETDGERAHLHFGLSKAAGVDVRGYVANKSELSQWIDPLSLF